MLGEGARRGPRYQNTTQPHPTEQQPTDIPEAEPNCPTNRTTQAHTIVSANKEHSKNHTHLQHPQQYISYQMQPTMQQEKNGLSERHTNDALQDSGHRRDHSLTSSSEIVLNNRSPNIGKNQIKPSRGVQPHRTEVTRQSNIASSALEDEGTSSPLGLATCSFRIQTAKAARLQFPRGPSPTTTPCWTAHTNLVRDTDEVQDPRRPAQGSAERAKGEEIIHVKAKLPDQWENET